MGLDVRRIEPAQLAEAGGLTVEAYAPFVEGPGDPYLPRLRDVAARDREAEVFVAIENGRVLGCVTSCPPGSSWRELASEVEGEFRMLAVSRTAQGRGVGRALVEHCEERAREAGAVAMILSSLPAMSSAHRLYERLGYAREPARDWHPLPQVSLIAYAKDISGE